jgi:hypothetical protein
MEIASRRPSKVLDSRRSSMERVIAHSITRPMDREPTPETSYSDLSIAQLEGMLKKERPALRQPLTARGVLEENRIAAETRKAESARAKADGRAWELKLINERIGGVDEEIDQIRSRREAASALSKEYKAELERKEAARRRGSLRAPEAEFFPFTDGEQLDVKRQDLRRKHTEHLLDHLTVVNPAPREDPLRPRAVRKYGEAVTDFDPPPVHSFNSNYPSFLKKSREYATKFADPEATRMAMKQRVSAAYEAMQREYAAKLADHEERGVGLQINDSLMKEEAAAAIEKRKQVDLAVRQQMEERAVRRAEEKRAARDETHGYFGPTDKTRSAQAAIAKEHANDLMRQIEVDRARAQDLRAYELAQDRMHLESYAQEITNDARHGNLRRKKNQRLLKQSWEQQVKMRQVRAIVQNT